MSGRSFAALFSVFAPVAVCLMMPLPAVGQTTADTSTQSSRLTRRFLDDQKGPVIFLFNCYFGCFQGVE